MAKATIYHNPRCTKSRQAVKLLEEKKEDFDVVLYLEDSLTHVQLSEIIDQLGIQPQDLLRKWEAVFKEKFKGKDLSDSDWIQAMIDHP